VRAGAGFGPNSREMYDRAVLLVPRRCVRAGAGSGPNSCEVYDRAVLLIPRRCVRVDAGSDPNSTFCCRCRLRWSSS